MLSLFGFGKKARRSTTKASKPPSRLLKICKKYRVKTTAKRGGKRVYRPTAMLKKLCLRKARALKKKLMKGRSTTRRSRMGGEMEFGKGRRAQMEFGSPEMEFGKGRRAQMEFGASCGNQMEFGGHGNQMEFGKRRKVNKVAAMKAFKSFYRRHCAPRGSRFGFGSGGNPPLWQSMGYEFCSDGGGVLGANSTGLFPTPCMPPPSAARPTASRPSAALPSAVRPKAVAAKKLSAALKKASPKTKAAVRKLIKKAAPKAKAAVRRVGKGLRKVGSAVRRAAPRMARKAAPKVRSVVRKAAPKVRSAASKAKAALRRKRATAFGFW
jgi:hypothetical protein